MPCSSNDTGAGGSWVETCSPAAFLISPVPPHSSSSRERPGSSLRSVPGDGRRSSARSSIFLSRVISSQPAPSSPPAGAPSQIAAYSQPSQHFPSRPHSALGKAGLPSQTGASSAPGQQSSLQNAGAAGRSLDVYSAAPAGGESALLMSRERGERDGSASGGSARVRDGGRAMQSDSSQEVVPSGRSLMQAPSEVRGVSSTGLWASTQFEESAASPTRRPARRDGSADAGRDGGETEGEAAGVVFYTPLSSPLKVYSASSSRDHTFVLSPREPPTDQAVSAAAAAPGAPAAEAQREYSRESSAGSVDWSAMCSRTYTPKLGLLQRCYEETDARQDEENDDDSDVSISSLPASSSDAAFASRPAVPSTSAPSACRLRGRHARGDEGGQVYRQLPTGTSSRPVLRHPCQRPLCWKRTRRLEERPRDVCPVDDSSAVPFEEKRRSLGRRGFQEGVRWAASRAGYGDGGGDGRDEQSARNAVSGRARAETGASDLSVTSAGRDIRGRPARAGRSSSASKQLQRRVVGEPWSENRHSSADADAFSCEEGSPLFVSPVGDGALQEPDEGTSRGLPTLGAAFPTGDASALLASTSASAGEDAVCLPGRAEETSRGGEMENASSPRGNTVARPLRTGVACDFFTPGDQEEERESRRRVSARRLHPESGRTEGGAEESRRRRSLGPEGWDSFDDEDSEASESSYRRRPGWQRRLPARETGDTAAKRGPEALQAGPFRTRRDGKPLRQTSPSRYSWVEAASEDEIDYEDRRLPKRRRFSLSTLEPQSSFEEDMPPADAASLPLPSASGPAETVCSSESSSAPAALLHVASSLPLPEPSLSSCSVSPASATSSSLHTAKADSAVAALLAAPPPPPSRLLRKRKRQSAGGVARRMLLHGPGFAGARFPSADEATLVNSLGTALTAEETLELRQREEQERLRRQMLERKRKEEEEWAAAELARLQQQRREEEKKAAALAAAGAAKARDAGAAAAAGTSSASPQFVFGARRPEADKASADSKASAALSGLSMGNGLAGASPKSSNLPILTLSSKALSAPAGGQTSSASPANGLASSVEKPAAPTTAGSTGTGNISIPVLAPGQRRPRLTIIRSSASSGNQSAAAGGTSGAPAAAAGPEGGVVSTSSNSRAPVFGNVGANSSVALPAKPASGADAGSLFGAAGAGVSAAAHRQASPLWGGSGDPGGQPAASAGAAPPADGLLPGFGTAGLGVAGGIAAPGAAAPFGGGLGGGFQDGGLAPAAGGANPFAFQRGGRGGRGGRGRGGRRR
ncbi:hypothetical protein BESB_046520 [Besnoitia besnoiti]|uniref:Uncharacterized protein n=1 Tax=Besnoitia besnoiti TaxID=94643 RepID=A0A2A9MLU2_BESBE|nr:hypothetical protein BESB_046520 [Besnoitia besnoiti]PFH36460.1 hypothetical protein BESB_046520 [Besnoitia besnoiti]